MKDKTTNLKRRGFLVTVGLGSAGAAASAFGGKTLIDKTIATENKSDSGKGYRLSEHVQNYYRSTRV
ncbi:MAG: hypothetical protein M9884_04640 [Rhodocyclaceae bacterium]|jgi:hypothetical protein|nr:hypothetical protein [Rhodocyclaceae bacterium]MCO5096744.1 hypothetical protein [Rhodocyclaceae bacterium]MCZ7656184.1 hypothetical protein [Rhodocyclaceae bacterium]